MKYLPSEIEINGVTYYSGLELASKQLDWYNLGKAVGVEEGKKEATLEKVDQFNKGYEIGKYEGLEKGKREQFTNNIKLIHESNEKSRKLGYEEGYTTGFDNGLDAATIANTTAVKPSPCNHGECIAGKEEEYDKGYYAGWEDGKNHIMQFI